MASGSITPDFLSASTNGRQIKVSATATPGTLLHTAVSGTASIDYVTLHAVNTSASSVDLTIEWGGTTSPDDHIVVTLGAKAGRVVVADHHGINNGLAIRAFAGTADVICIYGHVRTVEL